MNRLTGADEASLNYQPRETNQMGIRELNLQIIEAIRREIDEMALEYRVDENGLIRTPGSFEGEHKDILYWHAMSMDGMGESLDNYSDGSGSEAHPVDAVKREALLLEEDACWAVLSWSSNGFYSLRYITDSEYADLAK